GVQTCALPIFKNKEKALQVLRARLLERERAKAQDEARQARLVQIGSGERSERVRTYNFPQSRVTDHRIGFTTKDLAGVMARDLHELVAALPAEEQARTLSGMAPGGGEGRAPSGALAGVVAGDLHGLVAALQAEEQARILAGRAPGGGEARALAGSGGPA